MVSYRLVAVAGFFASAYALPLNINLGAYSPALVVGDGEISFGGGQDVSKLFNTLEGAAQSGSAAAAKSESAAAGSSVSTASVGGDAAAAAPKAASVPAEPAAAPQSTPAAEAPVAAAAAAEPEVKTEEASVAAAPDAKLQEQAAISSLQGMGKEIAPRDDGAEAPQKRDLAGFDRALKYAEAALTKGPVIQMGTGEKGAGVGLIVDNRPNAAVPGAAAKAKRDEVDSALPRRHTKVTTMYVRRGVPAEMQTTEFTRRGLKTIPVVARRDATAAASAALAETKRDASSSSSVLDSINLNVDDPQGVTMTFVEETDGDDNE